MAAIFLLTLRRESSIVCRFLTIVFALVVFSSNANIIKLNSVKSPVKSSLYWHGYIEKTGGRFVEDDTAITGLAGTDFEINILKKNTWRIPNRIGTGFIIIVDFSSIPKNIEKFSLQITYPEMTLPIGGVRSAIKRDIDLHRHSGSYRWTFDFYFDFPYETTPGDWKIKIYSEGDLIHSSIFRVVDYEKKAQNW